VPVYLGGAGPGDPGLLTVRGAEVLGRADVVVHDRLAEASLLERAPAGAERIDVGKTPGRPVAQEVINELLVERGRSGREIVRLKGGDPFVFGRGGEEAIALAAAGIPFEVVPGVTSAVAVPAYAGVPVTHRGLATSFTVVTGHSRLAVDEDTDWEALARAGGTIVVLMGVAHRDAIAERLVAGGLDPATPVVAVTWGTRPEQRTTRTTLAGLGAADLAPPATIVIGAVAGLDLSWYVNRPLFGRSVVVTRARSHASALTARLQALGARTVELPAIRIAAAADGGAGLAAAAQGIAAGHYDWVIFTSPNAAVRLADLLADSRAWAGARIAAIGTSTAEALLPYRLVADLVPGRFVAEALLDALLAAPSPGPGPPRALVPRAAVARAVLPDGLRAAGWEVDVVEAYRTVKPSPPPGALEDAARADAICFTSSSTVTNYIDLAGAGDVPPVVACIGPVTAATARDAGIEVTVEAAEHTIPGLVAALVDTLGRAVTPG
jgi:uroporphyrinogen III methyltransferase/synthase